MSNFSEQILSRIDDPATREETERSIKQRGVMGHYIAGAYRTLGRPLAQWQIIQRARFIYFMWGMDGVANFIEKIPERYLNAVMREFGAYVAESSVMGDGIRFATVHGIGLGKLSIGHKAFFGRRCIIDMSHEVTFGDFCTLGNETQFISHTDFANSPLKKNISPMKRGPVRIGRGAFIASNTMIAHSTTIGECSIVAAFSFVDKHVPPFTFVGGTPARVIAKINPEQVEDFNPAIAKIIPEGSTIQDFDYDSPDALKIPENCRVLGS